jgi:peptidoglycan glycosyltransferase
MDRQIRIMGVVLASLFALLFLQLNNVQVLQAKKLSNDPANPRVASRLFDRPRGDIVTADGVLLVHSVHLKEGYQREYPHGPLFADITGYFSLVYGTWGVESSYNGFLTTHQQPIRNLDDLITAGSGADDVTLTINSVLQQTAANDLGVHTGAVVALNPKTGAIYAMYSSPSYDPNALSSLNTASEVHAWNALEPRSPSSPLLDRAFRQTYAPGSTFKIITSSAVYDHDPQLATQSFPYLSGLKLPDTDKVLSNYAGETCGGTLPTLLAVSCDSGFGQIGLDLGAANLVGEAEAFGFNQVPPLDLPGAVASRIPPASAFANNLPGLAYSAIGQENVSATPLEMALATSAIANNGVIMAPHVMAEVRDPQGRLVKAYHPHAWLRATSPATAQAVTTLMEGVVANGTASNIAIPGLLIAAKTGTAQTSQTAGSNNWLVAFAPADDPTFVVAAAVPAQAGLPLDTTGSEVAGPIVKSMIEQAMALGIVR